MRSRRVALIEGTFAGVSFGTAAIFLRLLSDLNAFSKAFWRLIIAVCALGVLVVVSKRSFERCKVKENFRQFIILGTLLGLHFILFASAVEDTTLLNATVLVNTAPIFSMLISSFLFKAKPSHVAVIGLLVSFLGVSIIAFADASRAGASSSVLSVHLRGDFEAVLAAVAEGFYLNYGREMRGKIPLIPLMIAIYSMSALTVAVASVVTSNSLTFTPGQPSLIPCLIGLGIVPTAFAHTFYFSSLSHLKSYETATMALLEPIGATMLGIAVFSEIPTPFFILGAFLVLCGIFSVVAAW